MFTLLLAFLHSWAPEASGSTTGDSGSCTGQCGLTDAGEGVKDAVS